MTVFLEQRRTKALLTTFQAAGCRWPRPRLGRARADDIHCDIQRLIQGLDDVVNVPRVGTAGQGRRRLCSRL